MHNASSAQMWSQRRKEMIKFWKGERWSYFWRTSIHQDAHLDDVLVVLYAHAPACLLHIAHGTTPSQSPCSPGTSDITQTQRCKTRWPLTYSGTEGLCRLGGVLLPPWSCASSGKQHCLLVVSVEQAWSPWHSWNWPHRPWIGTLSAPLLPQDLPS